MTKWGASRNGRRRGPRSYPEQPAGSIAEALQRARRQMRPQEEMFEFSGRLTRCSRCRAQVELLVGEEAGPRYLCADCDAGIYPDPREER